MEREEALAFCATHHRGVLATLRRDGKASLTPVSVGADGAGHVVISTRASSHKVANLARHSFASLCVFTDSFFGPYVQLEGAVEIVPLPDAMDGLVALYRQVAGEHPDWDEFRTAMVQEQRVLIRLSPERVGPSGEH